MSTAPVIEITAGLRAARRSRIKGSNERASKELARCVRRFAPAADDQAVHLLVTRCLSIDPAASDQEIAHFVAIKAQQAIASRRVQNLVGFLIWAVPRCFGGGMVEEYRAAVRAAQDQERSRWQAVLDDPGADQEVLNIARQELARLAGVAHPGAQVAPEGARW